MAIPGRAEAQRTARARCEAAPACVSSVWIAHLRNLDSPAVRCLRELEDIAEILVGDLILLEVLQGTRSDPHAKRIERDLRAFAIDPMLDAGLAVRAAAHYRLLRRRGVTVRKSIDLVIATFCIEGNHMLLHQDRDFEPMAEHLGLRVLR